MLAIRLPATSSELDLMVLGKVDSVNREEKERAREMNWVVIMVLRGV